MEFVRFYMDSEREVTYYLQANADNYEAIQDFKGDVENYDMLYHANGFCPYVLDDFHPFEEDEVDQLCRQNPHRHRKIVGEFEWKASFLGLMRFAAYNALLPQFEASPKKWESYYIVLCDCGFHLPSRFLKLTFNGKQKGFTA